ncbi:hypothetical protein NUM3379_06430 [Kineococcus sp. NUM-3379]
MRALADAVGEAVRAAQDGDTGRHGEAAARLAQAEPEHVRLVLGAVVRALVEQLHPEGIDADDVREVVTDCLRGTAGWTPTPPEVDPFVLVVLVCGALGVHPDDPPPGAVADDGTAGEGSPPLHRAADPAAVAAAATVLVAHLLRRSGRRLPPLLAAAFTEIARAETQD